MNTYLRVCVCMRVHMYLSDVEWGWILKEIHMCVHLYATDR